MKQETHISIEKTDAETYSLSYLRTISENDENFIIESLHIFKFSVAVKLMELSSAVKRGDEKRAGEIAHNIKPSFEMLSIDFAREICDELYFRTSGESLEILFNKLETGFLKIMEAIEKDFPQLK